MNLNTKTVILIFVSYYLPGFRGGGPIRSIANMVERLGDQFDFRIVTMDRDLGELHPHQSIKVNAWNKIGKAQVFYLCPASRSLWNIIKLMRSTQHDILYLNSFFDVVFTLKPLLGRWLGLVSRVSTVLAPRGEFSQGAYKLKYWKKLPFTKLVCWIGLLRDVRWHASTNFESLDIHRVIEFNYGCVKNIINVACDLMVAEAIPISNSLKMEIKEYAIQSSSLRVCFLSRIVPMKNIDYALKVLAKVEADVHFNIYGPKELPAYWAECELLIAQLPPNVRVSYHGSVENSQVRSVIADHDLFFVPSLGENFGHVFIESLSAGVPILVSDRTPWRDLEQQKLGWDISLDQPDRFLQALEEAAQFSQIKRAEMKACCIAYAHKKSENGEVLMSNRNLFLDAICMHKLTHS